MCRERQEQAFGSLTTRALDALGDPLRIDPPAPGAASVTWTRVIMSVVSRHQFRMREADCLNDGSDEAVCLIEVGSCSLQEEQML